MLKPITLSLVFAVSTLSGLAPESAAATDAFCSEPYACIEQVPMTEAEIFISLLNLQPPVQPSLPSLDDAQAAVGASSVRR